MNIQRVLKQVEFARESLKNNPSDPGLAVQFVKHLPELEELGLADLAWLLAGEQYGCSVNDVHGLLDDIVRATLGDGLDDAMLGALP